jgi:hypothetical protein
MPPHVEAIVSVLIVVPSVFVIYKAGQLNLFDLIVERLENWSHWEARQKMVWAARRYRSMEPAKRRRFLAERRFSREARRLSDSP